MPWSKRYCSTTDWIRTVSTDDLTTRGCARIAYFDEPAILQAPRSSDKHTGSGSYPLHSKGHTSPGKSTWGRQGRKVRGCPRSAETMGSWVQEPLEQIERPTTEQNFRCSSSERCYCYSYYYHLCQTLGVYRDIRVSSQFTTLETV
jgi:hypothetical protein